MTMKLLRNFNPIKYLFIVLSILSFNFPKTISEENFESLNLEYLNKKQPTKYIIGSGDTLEIKSIQFEMENDEDFVTSISNSLLQRDKYSKYEDNSSNKNSKKINSNNFLVKGDGTINLPRLRNIYVEGLTVEELTYLLNKKYQEFFINPDFTVEIKKYRNISVYIDGEVNIPGLYKIPGIIKQNNNKMNSGLFPTLYDALNYAGGVTSYSDLSNVEIQRINNLSNGGGKIRTYLNFLDVIETGRSSNNIRIYDGDIIKVAKSDVDLNQQLSKAIRSNLNPRFIKVIISGRIVGNSGLVEVSKSSTLNDIILLKGGIKPLSGKISFLRYSDNGLIENRSFKYKKNSPKGSYTNPILRNGDVIIVGQSGFNTATSLIKEITAPFIGINAALEVIEDFN